MFRREAMIKEIARLLSWLETYVRKNNKLGWTDVNHAAEDFYCGLLNTAFGWKLENLNSMQMDFPAIDLGDNTNHICVQVTSTEDRSKIQSTLDKFFAHNLDGEGRFRRLIVLIIGSKANYRDPFRVKEGFAFDPGHDIWDTGMLIAKMESLELDALEQIARYLRRQLNIPGGPGCVLKLPMPDGLGEEAFIGRKEELAALAKKMADPGKKRIYVTGLGGMGKTALVIKFCTDYLSEHRDRNVYFVRFRESFKQTVAMNVAEGFREDPPAPEHAYDAAIAQLRLCSPGDILVIDNADEKDREFSRLKDEAFEELRKLDMKLIITTRCPLDDAIEVGAMETNLLRQIFRRHGVTNLLDTLRDDLIEAVGRHTMTVDLMARTLKHNRLLLKPEELLKTFRDGTLPEKKLRPVESGREDARQEQIYIHLRNLFRVTDVSGDARELLRHAVLLPDGGMEPELFLSGLPEEARYTAQNLEEWGWLSLEGEEGLLAIHPVVRLVCRAELKPDDESCKDFLDKIFNQYDRTQYDAARFRQYAELFSQAAEMLPDSRGNWALLAGKFWEEIGLPEAALHYNLITVNKREKIAPDSRDLTVAYNNLAVSYLNLGNYSEALDYHLKDLEISEKILHPYDPHLAVTYNNVGMSYGALNIRWKELDYLHKALSVYEKTRPADHPDLAYSYDNVGGTYAYMEKHQKVLEYRIKALTIRKKILSPTHPELALSYKHVGDAYINLGNDEKALEYHLKALDINEKTLPAEHPELAYFYNSTGVSYRRLGDYENALKYHFKALNIQEKVLPWTHPDLAVTCDSVAETYQSMENYEKALEYSERSLAIKEYRLHPEHLELADAYFDLGITCSKLGEMNRSLDYYLKALVIRQKRLPDDDPELAKNYGSIGDICAEMAWHETAVTYARCAQDCLPWDHPDRKTYEQKEWEYQQKLEKLRREESPSGENAEPEKKKTSKWWNPFRRKKD